MEPLTILRAISSTEPVMFGEFCGALGSDKPDNREDWRTLFLQLERLEAEGLVDVERMGGKIETLILTDAGSDKVREANRK